MDDFRYRINETEDFVTNLIPPASTFGSSVAANPRAHLGDALVGGVEATLHAVRTAQLVVSLLGCGCPQGVGQQEDC